MQMNESLCLQILQFLSVKLTQKPLKIKYHPNNRITVYFGDLPLFYKAVPYETNGLYKKYTRILTDIIEFAAKSPINVSIPIYDEHGWRCFKPVIPMNTTFEQLLVMKDLEDMHEVE